MSRADVTQKILAVKVAKGMDIKREADPKGDRVQVVISGKFPPYKTY